MVEQEIKIHEHFRKLYKLVINILENDYKKHQSKPFAGICQCYDCMMFQKFNFLNVDYNKLTEEQKQQYKELIGG